MGNQGFGYGKDTSSNQFESGLELKPVGNPSDNTMVGIFMADSIRKVILTILWMVFLSVVGVPAVIRALEIIYG